MSRNANRRIAPRRSTPKVKDGKVQRKNRSQQTRTAPLIRREQPGAGYRHFVRKSDVAKFITLLPQWDDLSVGLTEIILARAEPDTAGWHRPGSVAVCAWERQMPRNLGREFVQEHSQLYDRLGISYVWVADDEYDDAGYFTVEFTVATVRAYQLLHILLHELGHHHDRMTTKPQECASRGESFAEQYALKYEAVVFDRYCEVFDFPGRPTRHGRRAESPTR